MRAKATTHARTHAGVRRAPTSISRPFDALQAARGDMAPRSGVVTDDERVARAEAD